MLIRGPAVILYCDDMCSSSGTSSICNVSLCNDTPRSSKVIPSARHSLPGPFVKFYTAPL